MKQFFLPVLLVAFIVTSFPGNSQVLIGVKSGINFNSFRKSERYKNHFDVIPGFNAGAFAKYPALPFLTARVEALYMQQGANIYDYRVINELYRRNAKIRFHAFEVPVLVELGLPSLAEDILQPKILLGGFYSYTLYTRESYMNVIRLSGGQAQVYEGYSDVQSQYYRSQVGLIGALAAEMKVFSQPVSIELRYQYNLNRVNKPGTQLLYNLAPTADVWGDELMLHTLSVNVGVMLYDL